MTVPASWTEEEIAACLRLRIDGRSASEIGRELGRSRNAIIGIMHRNRDLFPIEHPEKQTIASREKPAREAKLRHHMVTTTRRVIVERPRAPEIAAAEPVRFVDVTDRQCKWPLWPIEGNPGPDGPCCGTSINLGDVYCAHHRRLSRGAGTPSERSADQDLRRAAR